MRRPSAVRQTTYPQHDIDVMGGMRLRYVDVGKDEGQPPLVLIHGLASRIEEYQERACPPCGMTSKDEQTFVLVPDSETGSIFAKERSKGASPTGQRSFPANPR